MITMVEEKQQAGNGKDAAEVEDPAATEAETEAGEDEAGTGGQEEADGLEQTVPDEVADLMQEI